MDKARKLRRYNRKDYTQLVDFPVEIVGRDGSVQQYSFEDAVSLYHRRVASAQSRYDDGDIVAAEVRHCRRRIEQLRRSYFTRYGWAAVRLVDRHERSLSAGLKGSDASSELAGEVAAFLRRTLPATSRLDLEAYHISLLNHEAHQGVYCIRGQPQGSESLTLLLYIYRFGGERSPIREQYLAFLRILQQVQGGGQGVEALVAHHHTADCGLILTGRAGAMPEGDVLNAAERDPPAEELDDPLRAALLLMRRGNRVEALARFTRAYEVSPYRRVAYMGAIVVADQLGAHAEALMAATMAARYFPDDPMIIYHLALSRLRTGDHAAAAASLARMPQPGEPPVVLLEAILALVEGRIGVGRPLLRQLGRDTDDVAVRRSVRLLRAQIMARDLLRYVGGGGLIAAGVIGLATGWYVCGLLLPLGAFVFLGAQAAWRRQVQRLVEAPSVGGLPLANPVCLRGGRDPLENPQ